MSQRDCHITRGRFIHWNSLSKGTVFIKGSKKCTYLRIRFNNFISEHIIFNFPNFKSASLINWETSKDFRVNHLIASTKNHAWIVAHV